MKISVTIDDLRMKSNLKINQSLIFTERFFFYTILGFTRSRSYPLEDTDGFYQLIVGSNKTDRTFKVTGINKVHLNVIVIMVVLSMGQENEFCTVLLCLHHTDVKITTDLESIF